MPEEAAGLHIVEKRTEKEKWGEDAANNCMRACENTTSCFQYLWDGASCKVSTNFFSLGSMKKEEAGPKWVSGWNLKMVKKFQEENAQCKGGLWEYDD
jgi:hypothetical protein